MSGLRSPRRDPHRLPGPRRTIPQLALCLVLCASSIGPATTRAAAQAAPGVEDLALGRPIERTLAGGQSDEFRLTVARGDFVRIVAAQHGVDVALYLYRPDGTLLLGRNTEPEVQMPEVLVAVADATGVFTLKVTSPGRGPAGRYAIRLEDARPATPRDADFIAAERAFEHGVDVARTVDLNTYPDGLGAVITARDGFHRLDERSAELRCWLAQADFEWYLARPTVDATAAHAEQLAVELHDDVSRSYAIRLQGLAAERAGDMATAARLFDDALGRYRALRDEPAEAMLLQDAGRIFGRTGDSDRAVARLEEALAIDRRRHDTVGVDLNNLGIAYKDVGEFDKALAAYQEILGLPELAANPFVRARVLNNAGNLQHLLGHDDAALALHLEALPLSQTIGDRETEARSLNTIGQTYASLRDYDRAVQYERDGLAIRRSIADLSGQAASLTALGAAEEHLGHFDEAYGHLSDGLAILTEIREAYSEPNALKELAAIDRARGDLPRAIEHVRAAVALDEELRARMTSPELRSSFVATAQDNYELYIDLLQQQAASDPAGGHVAAALEVSERARARVLLESLLDARVDLRQGIDPALLDRERSLQKQLSTVSAQISRALAAPGATAAPAALVNTYDRLTGDYQRQVALIRQQSPRYADMTHPAPLTTPAIQHDVLDGQTVLLEFELGADRGWLWAVTPTTLASVPLPPRAEIDAAARGLYDAIAARERRPGETAAAFASRVSVADHELGAKSAALSHLLFDGVSTQLGGAWRGKRLAIVPAGSLEYVAFAALPLMSGHEIVRVPSASVLAALRSESTGRPVPAHTLAVFADPVFDSSDPRLAAARQSSGPPKPDAAATPEDIDEALYARAGLARLPFSRQEANAIASLAGRTDTFEATDFSATRIAALSPDLAGYRIVHFATHGIVDSARPSLSGLVFSLVNERGEPQNGFLRLPDIYDMRLNADLVVLSGCQTALGKAIKGEGLIGLTRAFMYAGSPRVVASLWEVSDEATSELMKRFYSAMLERHLPPAAALRTAQADLARIPRWSAPYFWAGFVFVGDWR